MHRESEAELFSASYASGLGVVTWSPLGGGMLTGKYWHGEKERTEGFGGRVFQAENTQQRTGVLDTVLAIAIASELGVNASQVTIARAGTHGAVPRSSDRARLPSFPKTSVLWPWSFGPNGSTALIR